MTAAAPDGITPSVMSELSDVIVENGSLQNNVTFTWSGVDYGYPAAVTYTLYAVYGDSEPYALGESNTTNYTLTKEALNNALVDKYGLAVPENETSTIYFYIVSSISEQRDDYKFKSNTVSMQITTINSTSAPWIRRPLYIPGSHQGWSPDVAPVLWETSEYSDEYEGLIYLADAADPTGVCEFKVCPNPNWTDNFGGTFAALTTEGNPANLQTTGGTYWVKVTLSADHTTGTVSLTPVTTVGVIGTAIGGWGDTEDLVMTVAGLPTDPTDPNYSADWNTAVNNQIWEASTTTAIKGDFKYRLNNAWSYNWGGDLSKLEIGGANCENPYTGNATFTINFKGDVASLIQDTNNPSPISGTVSQ